MMTKKTKSREYRCPTQINARGATAPDGTPYICIEASDRAAWISRADFAGNGTRARRILETAGIPLLFSEWKTCKQEAAKVEKFPEEPLVDHIGWNPPHYALGDGKVFAPRGAPAPVVLFQSDKHKWSKMGNLRQWRKISGYLSDQLIATFVVMTAYAGPLLELINHPMNIGFELTGPRGVGKTTLQRLAASVLGPADDPSGFNYWVTANTTMNGLETLLPEYNDASLIIEEGTHFGGADHVAARAAKWNDLVFRLSDGYPKRRYNSVAKRRSRFVVLISANEPLSQVLSGHRVAVAEAAADRLITIPISPERQFGVFDSLPPQFEKSVHFARYFETAVRNCYGVGFRRFIRSLVRKRDADEKTLVQQIRKVMSEFRERAGVDGNSGAETRVADAFGIVVAAGYLAISYEAISAKVDPMAAGINAYNLHLYSRKTKKNHLKRLVSFLDDFDALLLEPGRLHNLTQAEIEEYSCIIRPLQKGSIELLFTPLQLAKAFPDRRALFADPDIQTVLVAEEGRRQTKRQIRRNCKAERVHCFRFPVCQAV